MHMEFEMEVMLDAILKMLDNREFKEVFMVSDYLRKLYEYR